MQTKFVMSKSLTTVLALSVFFMTVKSGTGQVLIPEKRLALEELELMVLAKNPTIAQGESAIRAAEGYAIQAGLYPNPIVGYEGVEFSRGFTNTSEHFLFLEQRIVTAGKLKKGRQIFQKEGSRTRAELQVQKLKVINTVRLLYYEALGAQLIVHWRGELARIVQEALDVSDQLFNVGAADRPDVLGVSIEAERARLGLLTAKNHQRQVSETLAAMVGIPTPSKIRLAGELSGEIPHFDQSETLTTLLRESPEIRRAEARLEQMKAILIHAKVKPIPDLVVRGGMGYSFEPLEAGDSLPRGLEGFVAVGIEIPLFDRNQGAIAAAEAEIVRAKYGVQRIKLALQNRLEVIFARYVNAREAVKSYRDSILPQAQKAYDLYLAKFQSMAAAYPQVLIAQRTLFEEQITYTNSLIDLWQSAVQLRGLTLTDGLNLSSGVLSQRLIGPSIGMENVARSE